MLSRKFESSLISRLLFAPPRKEEEVVLVTHFSPYILWIFDCHALVCVCVCVLYSSSFSSSLYSAFLYSSLLFSYFPWWCFVVATRSFLKGERSHTALNRSSTPIGRGKLEYFFFFNYYYYYHNYIIFLIIIIIINIIHGLLLLLYPMRFISIYHYCILTMFAMTPHDNSSTIASLHLGIHKWPGLFPIISKKKIHYFKDEWMTILIEDEK